MKMQNLLEVILPTDDISKEKLDKRIRDLSRLLVQARASAQKAASMGKNKLAQQLMAKADEIEDLINKVYQDTIDPDTEEDEDKKQPQVDGQDQEEEDEEDTEDQEYDNEEDEELPQETEPTRHDTHDLAANSNSGRNNSSGGDDNKDQNNSDDDSDEDSDEEDSNKSDGEKDSDNDKSSDDEDSEELSEDNKEYAEDLKNKIDDILDEYNEELTDKQKEQLENLKNKLDDLKEKAEASKDNLAKQEKISEKLSNIDDKLNSLEEKLENKRNNTDGDNADGEDADADDDDLDSDSEEESDNNPFDDEDDDGEASNSKEKSKNNSDDDADGDDSDDDTDGDDSDGDDSDEDSSDGDSDDESESGEEADSDDSSDQDDDDQDSDESDNDDEDDSSASSSKKSGGKTSSKGKNGSSNSSSSDDEDSEESEDEDGDESDNDNNDEDESDDDNKDPVKDPFADEEDVPTWLPGMGGKQPREANLKDIIKILKQLSGESKRGAIDGLKDLVAKNANSTNESLTEAVHKNLSELTDDEYGDFTNEVIDLITQIDDMPEIPDIDERINKINKMMRDPKTARALKQDDNVELRKDFIAKKARDNENEKYKNYPTIKQFEIDFYDTIKNQVQMIKQNLQTYDEVNNEYEFEDIIMKADVIKEIPEEEKPVIDFYFDCSGSWTNHPDAIEIGKRAVATIKEFEDRDEIKLNIYYFGETISTDMYARGVWDGYTTAWNEILQNIKATKATNVVLMTDCDMAEQAKYGPTCVVDGCVWFIWSLYDYTRGSKQIVKHLKGMQGQVQCAFGSGGTYYPSNDD